jgi:hypothetical protein
MMGLFLQSFQAFLHNPLRRANKNPIIITLLFPIREFPLPIRASSTPQIEVTFKLLARKFSEL